MSNYKTLQDIELFEKIVKYDSKALEELYLRYSPILYSLIKKIVPDVGDSEKILLDVFTTVWAKIDLFNFKTANVYTWLITLARNKAVYFKTNPEEKPSDKFEDFYIVPLLDPSIDSLSLDYALKVKNEIADALNNLTDAQRYVLILAYYDGLTLDQIAEKLNIPVPTVRNKIMVSLNNLKKNLLGG